MICATLMGSGIALILAAFGLKRIDDCIHIRRRLNHPVRGYVLANWRRV